MRPDPRERLLKVLRREPVDRPPFVCPGGMMTMAVTEVMDRIGRGWPEAHSDPKAMADLTVGMVELGGLENLGVPFCMTVEAEAMGARVDLGTRDGEPRVVAYAAERTADGADLPELDLERGRARVCLEAVAALEAKRLGVPIIANVVGPISLATSVVDPMAFYRDMRRDPGAARAVIERATENAARFGEAMIDAGADVVCIADPSGTGELIGGAAFSSLALPALNAMTRRFRQRGALTIVHICGRIDALHEQIGRLEAAAVSVDSCVSLTTLRSVAAGKAVMGNMSTFKLQRGDAAEAARSARACLRQNVDLLAPACGLSARTPLENVRSVARVAAEAAEEHTGGVACTS